VHQTFRFSGFVIYILMAIRWVGKHFLKYCSALPTSRTAGAVYHAQIPAQADGSAATMVAGGNQLPFFQDDIDTSGKVLVTPETDLAVLRSHMLKCNSPFAVPQLSGPEEEGLAGEARLHRVHRRRWDLSVGRVVLVRGSVPRVQRRLVGAAARVVDDHGLRLACLLLAKGILFAFFVHRYLRRNHDNTANQSWTRPAS
jgi:hypothetical protein